MSTKATAARIYEYGEPDVFRFETMDVPDPVGHEVLVRNTVIGLNFVDIYYRRGTLPVPEFPAIIGDEASGVVRQGCADSAAKTVVTGDTRVCKALKLFLQEDSHRLSTLVWQIAYRILVA